MKTQPLNLKNGTGLYLISSEVLIQSEQDALDVMGETDTDTLVLHDYNFGPEFFDLSTGLLGAVLQKFANYHVRMAVIGDFSKYPSTVLPQFIAESNRYQKYLFVSSLEEVKRVWGGMPNQQQRWNSVYSLENTVESSTDFAEQVLKVLPPSAHILELGCGLGAEAMVFAEAGHQVVATDFSEVIISQNKAKNNSLPNLSFEVLDMIQKFPFEGSSFDLVYAHLSLHYFTPEVTKDIVKKIHTVLKPSGLFCFVCRSLDDPFFGQGTKIAENMYERNGKVRHFFSRSFTESLLSDGFEILSLQESIGKLYNKDSAFIKVITAKK